MVLGRVGRLAVGLASGRSDGLAVGQMDSCCCCTTGSSFSIVVIIIITAVRHQEQWRAVALVYSSFSLFL